MSFAIFDHILFYSGVYHFLLFINKLAYMLNSCFFLVSQFLKIKYGVNNVDYFL